MTDVKHLFGLIVLLLSIDSCRPQFMPIQGQQQLQGYCPYGAQPLMNQLNEPVACSTTSAMAQCPQGYVCTTDVGGMYCCSAGGLGGQYGQNPYVQSAGYGVNNYAQTGYGQNYNQQTAYGNTGYGNTAYGNTGYGNTGYGTGYGNTGYGTGYNTGYGTGYGNTGYGSSGSGGMQYCPGGSVPYFAPGASYPTSCTIGVSTCPYSNTCQSRTTGGYSGSFGYCCSGGIGGGGSSYGKKKK